MRITPKTRINDLIDTYPFLLEFLPAFNAKYELLKNITVKCFGTLYLFRALVIVVLLSCLFFKFTSIF